MYVYVLSLLLSIPRLLGSGGSRGLGWGAGGGFVLSDVCSVCSCVCVRPCVVYLRAVCVCMCVCVASGVISRASYVYTSLYVAD